MKDEIMANLRNLRQPIEKFKGISISHDLHPLKKEKKLNAWWKRLNRNMFPAMVIRVRKTTNS